MTATRTRRTYDHRLRQLVRETGDTQLAVRNGVPPSTARDWSRRSAPKVISLDLLDAGERALRREVAALRGRNARLVAMLRLIVVLLKVFGVTLANRRLADGSKNKRILRAIERSRKTLPLRTALRGIGLSASRYHSWKSEASCDLEDASSCPRTSPHQLTGGPGFVIRSNQVATRLPCRRQPLRRAVGARVPGHQEYESYAPTRR